MLLEAHLVAAIQIMVYGGAIVVLFLFVVMLLNLRDRRVPTQPRQRLVKLAARAGRSRPGELLRACSAACPSARRLPEGFGGYRRSASRSTPTTCLLVEMASLLLLAAIVGALILAKRKID